MDKPNAVNADAILAQLLKCNAADFQVEHRSDNVFVQQFVILNHDLKSKCTQYHCGTYKTVCII